MDKEPELPPRPSESSVERSKSSFMIDNQNLFRLTSVEAELWDFVPPVPEDDNNDSSSTSNNNFNSTLLSSIHNDNRHNQHKNNILYDLNLSNNNNNNNNNLIQRPNNLFKTSNRLSASSEQISPTKNRIKHHLIDWNSSNKNNNKNTTSNSNNSLFDKNGNSHNNSRRCQSLIPNSNMSINFQLNPLYHNSNSNLLNNNMNNNNYANQNDNNNLYANLYWPLKTTSSSLPVTSPLTSPQTPFFSNNFQRFQMIPNNNNLDDQINQQLIEKIRSTSFKNNNNNNNNNKNNNKNPHLNVLQPTTIYEQSPEDPKQIINLFDPLAETIPFTKPSFDNNNFIVEHNYVNTNSLKNNENNSKRSSNSSTLSSSSLPSPVNKKVEDIINNNNSNNINSSPNKTIFKKETSEQQLKINSNLFELFKVENRDNYNKEFDEFCEHLKSLYMTCFQNKSTSSCDINSGLVYSPRIDIDIEHSDNVNNQSDRLYLYGMANTNNDLSSNRKSSDISCSQFTDDTNNDENLIIIDVRFHSLVYQKITGQTPNAEKLAPCVKVLDSNYFWFSMKFPVDFDKTVDMIVSHVVYNVAENEDSQVNINDFILKLNGINEFLQPDTLLSSYVYFQNCKKNNKHVILELVDQTSPDFWRPFLRCESDTRNILNDLKLDRILPKNVITNFIGYNASKLNDLIDELNTVYTEFISSVDESFYSKQSKKILIDQIVEKISSLCRFLSNIETSELAVAVEKFRYCYQNYFETSSSPIDLSIEQIRKKFEEAYLFIIQALLNIIQMYSKTFPVAFKLPKINNDRIPKAICFDDDEQNDQNKFVTLKRKRKREISQIMDMFIIHVDVCGQISKKWLPNYANFAIIVNLFHGFNLIKSKITEKSELYGSSQNNKKLMFNQNLDFDTPIYMLPRETRIEFILVGYRNTSNNKTEMDALATTFCYLYDNDEFLMNGSHLLPWNEIKCPPTLSGISFEFDSDKKPIIMRELLENHYQVSHNLDPSASMLVISLAPNLLTNIEYTFPQIEKRKEQMSLNYIIPLNDDISHINEDSLYGFHGCNPKLLNSKVIKILQKNPIEQLTNNERDIIWKDRYTLKTFPESILKILKSPPSWSCHDLRDIYDFLAELDSGPFKRIFRTKIEALQLLSMDYPDKYVRRTVVKWLNSVSVDELCDYLPQLVQSLRFETSFDSHLIWSLFEFSLMSARFCHYFYWQLKSCLDDFTFGSRCQIYLNSLLLLCGERTQEQFQQQDKICEQFSKISAEIKSKSKDSRSGILKQKLEQINEHLQSNPTSIPLSPSLFVNGLEVNQCSYFNSNSLPLKLVFDSAPPYRLNNSNIQNNYSDSNCNKLLQIYENKPYWHKIIFKCGDDLRKDMLVMQIISIINRVWFRAGLNLRLIIFGVLNTSDRTGMIEMVSKANTLREIQLEHGLTGNFKHHTIATWLKRHNTNEYDYKIAVENFIHSCAGYLVITYLLGICDRHNDNIMVTTSGNLFHIDFGKFFGDAQMMAGIKRDRVPFVFTADMAFVINEGGRPSKNYQFFIDLCCRCFILVRQNGNFLLSLLALMIRSGVDYLTNDTIRYFHDALMPNLIESEAKVKFNRLIEKALGSFSTQLNFFIHSIAQNFSGSGNGGNSNSQTSEDRQSNFYNNSFPESVYETVVSNNTPDYDELPNLDLNESESCSFSFTKCRVTQAMDGHITSLDIVNFRLFVPEKNEKVYFYKVKVDRQNYPENFVYRSFKEFIELHDKMTKIFPLVKFHTLKRSPMLNRSSRQEIASQRKREIQCFLKNLLQLASEISHSDIVYTFFHPILRDQHFHDVELDPTLSINPSIGSVPSVQTRQPKIKLNIGFRDEALHVLVCHVRNLDSDRVTAPDTYVKLYLKPDQNKSTKRKTRIMQKNAHPTFMESFVYPFPWEQLRLKILEVSVWESDMTGNKRLGQVMIPLQDLQGKIETWFQLKN